MVGKKDQKKRFWSGDENHSICAQARVAGVSLTQVVRCYSMNANLIRKWLRDPRFAADFSDDALEIDRVASSPASALPWALEVWLAAQRNRISGKSELAKAIRYAPDNMKKCAAIWKTIIWRSTIIQPSGRSAVWLWVEKTPLCGLQGRRRNGCHRLYCDRNRQVQGCRSPSPARLGSRQNRNHKITRLDELFS